MADLNHLKILTFFNTATEVRTLFLALSFWEQMLFAKGWNQFGKNGEMLLHKLSGLVLRPNSPFCAHIPIG